MNFNDGGPGGEVLEGNLIYNFVRETGDHVRFHIYILANAVMLCKFKPLQCNQQYVLLKCSITFGYGPLVVTGGP